MCGSYLWRRLGKTISSVNFIIVQMPVVNIEKFSMSLKELKKTRFVTQPHDCHHQKQISAIRTCEFMYSIGSGFCPRCSKVFYPTLSFIG